MVVSFLTDPRDVASCVCSCTLLKSHVHDAEFFLDVRQWKASLELGNMSSIDDIFGGSSRALLGLSKYMPGMIQEICRLAACANPFAAPAQGAEVRGPHAQLGTRSSHQILSTCCPFVHSSHSHAVRPQARWGSSCPTYPLKIATWNT